MLLRNLFWEMLSQKETGPAFRKSPLTTDSEPYRSPLASGPELQRSNGEKWAWPETAVL